MPPDDSMPTSPRRPSAWSIGVAVAALGAGLLLVTGATTAQGSDLRAERRSELADLVRAREAELARQAERIEQLRSEILTAQGSATAAPPDSEPMNEPAAAAAGMTPVRGDALTVTLDDAPRQPGSALPDGVSADDLVVHQQDVQAVVNALWAGGASAMRIMDQRVVSTSAVRCVGNTLILQGRVYAPPFTVTAIGDPARLEASLAASPGVSAYRDWSDFVGLGYSVEQQSGIELPAYDGPVTLGYAKDGR